MRRGLELCEKLGANDESISLSCNQEEFNYIGPEVILDDSKFACFRYVYSVKTGERVKANVFTFVSFQIV